MTAQLAHTTFDAARAEAFAGEMLTMLNQGALSLMVSVGHRTQLFDAMANLPPATSQQIATAAGLHERYVREWLNALTTGRIVEYDATAKTYRLPAEHAAFLTRAAGSENMATFFQHTVGLATVEDEIIECFKAGGGVPYSAFGRFHEVMAEDSGQTIVAALEDHILPRHQGIDVLDVGCGSGRAMNKLAALFPASRFRGYDFAGGAIAAATAEAQAHGLTNVQFQVKDVTDLQETERYDLITTFDAIHDQAHPDRVLHNIYTALRPDGVYLMQDIRAASEVSGNLDHPVAPFLYTVSCLHCMTVSLAEGGMGLGTMWGREKASEMLAQAGFRSIARKELPHDIMNDYYVIRKG